MHRLSPARRATSGSRSWTNSSLESARRIYDAAGFRLTAEETSPVFPEGTLAQEFILDL